MWLHSEWLQRLGGGFGEQLAVEVLAGLHFILLGAHKDKEVVRLLKRVRRERKCLLTGFEQFLVYSLARAQSRLPGDMAEVGVYTGASAKLICEARNKKPLHLFDTFEGLPPSSAKDRNVYQGKSRPQYACSLESVQAYLQSYPDLHFYKGLFPETAASLSDRTFSFVHVDVDLYRSTLACLEFFYPRLAPGGILLSHDYSILSGVKSAFSEFMADKREGLVELPTTQCMIVKLQVPSGSITNIDAEKV
jgi:O-methyltransferase